MIEIDLSNKSAIITGGTRGIGRAISTTLAASGARIAAIYRSDDSAAEKLAEELGHNRHAAFMFSSFRADISIEEEAATAAQHAITGLGGGLDFLILDAAAGAGGPMSAMSTSDWKKPFDVNVHGAFYMVRACAPHIRPGGSIIFISSGAGHDPLENLSAYGASKAAVNHLSTVLAQELGPRGIRVNVVSPGHTYTGPGDPNLRPESMTDSQKQIAQGTALRRIGTAQDVANVVLWFVSDLAGFVTGQWIRVNGGRI